MAVRTADGAGDSLDRTLVYLARHGQTPLNESDELRGLTDRDYGQWTGVSRNAVNRQVLVALDTALGDPDALPQDNGCFNTLEWRGGSWTVLSVNELPADGEEN